jgi:hypothetical protein
MDAWISSFRCFSQLDCRPVPQADCQKKMQTRNEQIHVAFLFIGSQDLKFSGGESVCFLLLGEGRVLINESFN